MTQNEFLVKSAEICRIELVPFGCIPMHSNYMIYDDWNPLENVAQALEVLEATGHEYDIGKDFESVYEVTIWGASANSLACCIEKELTKAICGAVQKWMKQKEVEG